MDSAGVDTCYVDLDGTVLDVSARHFAAYRLIVQEAGGEALPRWSYWRSRRAGWSLERILEHSSGLAGQADYLRQRFAELIEEPALLALDVLKGGALRALARIDRLGYRLVLVTLRRRPDALAEELRPQELAHQFRRVLCSPWSGEALAAKRALLEQDTDQRTEMSWVIGDTGLDVLVARQLGMKAAAVTGGLETAGRLGALAPELLASSLLGIARRLPPGTR